MRVLVVEDEAALRDQLAGVLRQAGYAVDTAGDGERAEFLVHTERYDAALLDLGLPRIDGLTCCARRTTPARRSGAGPDRARHLAGQGAPHRRGADDYLASRSRIEELLARLRG